MRIRTLIGAAAAAVAATAGLVAPASATRFENPYIGLQACLDRHDFTEFFRNNSSGDKYCFSANNPNVVIDPTLIPLNHITWFHAGVNHGWFRFVDGADGRVKTYYFGAGDNSGCTDCTILLVNVEY
ncbi:hypothetical protein Q5425_39175 [Amycolatopsis sp. A133]|uniref:hypothetical protein n=1 Tax=Amycolatopsis sp. A133 TaxID=3064472 RepID=UPI0027F14806|nr:hypothetical protein [Amycolatopsis sp. A133]MDQ7809783.1 hypothetical protein [Amycolatopsis sp. A133]